MMFTVLFLVPSVLTVLSVLATIALVPMLWASAERPMEAVYSDAEAWVSELLEELDAEDITPEVNTIVHIALLDRMADAIVTVWNAYMVDEDAVPPTMRSNMHAVT